MRYRACWISDLHLGSKKAETDLIYSFLKKNEFDSLYLNGDIIDIWRWKQAGLLKAKNTQEHINVVQRILKLAKKETSIHFTIGNHDEFLMHFLNDSNTARNFGNINLAERVEHTTAEGKRYLVLHGHQFDLVTRTAPWISKLGDRGYESLIWVNRIVNKVRRRLGMRYWSLSKFIKLKVKKASMIIGNFEESALHYAQEQGFDGIICGHIHNPVIRMDSSGSTPAYLNSGCWTDLSNCNALVERTDGSIDLIHWDGERERVLKSTDPMRDDWYVPTIYELGCNEQQQMDLDMDESLVDSDSDQSTGSISIG
ncbi:MAG: UDP-2,3-diacylglucosamine diphosphatase [Phycisphaerales bacterium]|nr:UDP-2,3-diacylglucosamine diphosphatase [Phycisphaerales bacterium]